VPASERRPAGSVVGVVLSIDFSAAASCFAE
jgi:hypothetical protein